MMKYILVDSLTVKFLFLVRCYLERIKKEVANNRLFPRISE